MTSTSCLRRLREEMQHNGLKWLTLTVFWFSPWESSLVCLFYSSSVAIQHSHVVPDSPPPPPDIPPSTPSPESVRHKESASPMRGSVSDGDSLFSQDLGEDIVFNNKVGADLRCFHYHPILFVFEAELLFVLFLCVFTKRNPRFCLCLIKQLCNMSHFQWWSSLHTTSCSTDIMSCDVSRSVGQGHYYDLILRHASSSFSHHL